MFIDQRLAMWTMMVSPLAAMTAFTDWLHCQCSVVDAASRLVLCLVLYRYARPDFRLAGDFICEPDCQCERIFMLFHLSKPLTNRGNLPRASRWWIYRQRRIAKFQLATVMTFPDGG